MTICSHHFIASPIHGYDMCPMCNTFRIAYADKYMGRSVGASQAEIDKFFTPRKEEETLLDKVMSYVGIGNRALEICCAPGVVLGGLAERHHTAFGIEIAPENMLEVAQTASQSNTRIWQGFFPWDFFGLKDSYFDHIVAVNALEYVSEPELFIERCVDILAPEGKLIIMTPLLQMGQGPGVRVKDEERSAWVFGEDYIRSIFHKYFHSTHVDRWVPGHELIIGKSKRNK